MDDAYTLKFSQADIAALSGILSTWASHMRHLINRRPTKSNEDMLARMVASMEVANDLTGKIAEQVTGRPV